MILGIIYGLSMGLFVSMGWYGHQSLQKLRAEDYRQGVYKEDYRSFSGGMSHDYTQYEEEFIIYSDEIPEGYFYESIYD